MSIKLLVMILIIKLYARNNIFQFNFKKSLDLNLENFGLPYWAWINFMIYWTCTRKILELSYLDSKLFYDILELDLKSTQTTSLDLDSFYDIFDLNLKKTWTNLLDSDLF